MHTISDGNVAYDKWQHNSQPLHSAHPFHCTYGMYVVCFDVYCFYVLFHLRFIWAASLLLN